MRLRIALFGLGLAAAGLLPAASASACSCAPLTRASYEAADAAVIARLVEVVPVGSQASRAGEPVGIGEGRFKYRVRRVFKGPDSLHRGKRFTIRSSMSGASCGLPQRRKRYGLLLERDRRRHRWTASSCSVTSPSEMRRLAADDGLFRATRCPEPARG